MQPVYSPPDPGKIASQHGLIFGLILAFINVCVLLLNTFLFNSSANVGFAFLLSIVSFLLGLIAYFVVGILASKKVGRVSTGTIAGIWTGTISGVIGCVVSLLIFFTVSFPKIMATNASSPAPASINQAFQAGAVFGAVGANVFGVLFAIGLGAGIAALGGLIGKSTSNVVDPMPIYPPGYPPYQQPSPDQPLSPYPTSPYPHPQNSYPYQTNPADPYTNPTDPNAFNPDHPYFEQPR
jgi:hypothetical protein